MMDTFWEMPKQAGLLLEINIYATEKYWSPSAFILFVEGHREIKRHHQDGMARASKGMDQRIVAKTIAAEHAAGPGSDLDDRHSINSRDAGLAAVD